jgi:hypothetical protein
VKIIPETPEREFAVAVVTTGARGDDGERSRPQDFVKAPQSVAIVDSDPSR